MPDGRWLPPVGTRGHSEIDVADGPARIGTDAVEGILQGHRTRGGLVGGPGDALDQRQEGGVFLHALFEGGGELAIASLGRGDGLPGHHLGRNVPKIADHAVAATRERDAVDLPLVVLGHPAVPALLDPLGGDVRLASVERVAEKADDFIGIGL